MSEFWNPEWETKRIGELCDVIDPHPSHRAPEEKQDGIFFLGIGDLSEDGQIIGSKARRVSPDIFFEHQQYYQITGNTIGFCRVASVGKVIEFKGEYPEAITISPTLAIIEPRDIEKKFLAYCLRSRGISEQVASLSSGSTRESLGIKILRDLIIPIPPLPEQKKIAEILSGIDFLLKALNDLIAKQVSLKKAMTWDLMSHGAGSRDLKDSDQGKIPFDWEVRSLGSVFTLTSGKSKPKSLLSSIATGSEKIPVYGGNGITGYASEYLLDLPTITIGRVGEYCGAVHLTPNICWVTDNALYIKDRISDFDLPFMYYFLVFCEISKMRKKGGQPLISQKPILDLVVALPPIEEQRRIALTLNSISKNISIMEVRRQRIKEFRDSVSQDLLSGRKRVSI